MAALPGILTPRNGHLGQGSQDLIWALDRVSFEVAQGEAFGIIGPNGAGKSTTLKLLSRVTRPTTGNVTVHGRVAALIELGAGFHPDLTGRENTYLNGAILGLTRREIRRKFDAIVSFAELEDFVDMPVKRYSTGMYARLGFAIAAHVEPDVLLVDEVLAVGDEAFQAKCREFIHSFVRSGRTSLFVSHNLYAIEQLCDRVMWLDQGRCVEIGSPTAVVRNYLGEYDRRRIEGISISQGSQRERLRLQDVRVTDSTGHERTSFYRGDSIRVVIDYEIPGRIRQPYLVVWVSEAQGNTPLFSANMLIDGYRMKNPGGQGSISCLFKSVPLMPRAYNVWLEAYGDDGSEIIFKWMIISGFQIIDRMSERDGEAYAVGGARFTRAHSLVSVDYEWLNDSP